MKTDDLAQVRTLWAAADEMRANSTLSPAEYLGPVLGLIFPRLRRAPLRAGAARVGGLRADAQFASRVAQELVLPGGAALRTVEEITANDEDYTVEFKSTARRDLREGKPNKAMENAVVKTIAGFLNTDGGTLLIGADNTGAVLGLDHDYDRVHPKNGDGFVTGSPRI